MKETKTHTPHEKRKWVRITRSCNNKCVFCLDKESLTGEHISLQDAVSELEAGWKDGAARAVISGGEATIHPEFLDIVAAAKQTGYAWVQTISNGRMFTYKEFLDLAVKKGLNEITFSIHGHTPEIFEQITGVKGSYKQTFNGLVQALKTPGLVVSVDLVVNGLNVDSLDALIKMLIRLGVMEFDILTLVPFGRAWDNWSKLYVPPEAQSKKIVESIKYAKEKGAVIWTSRINPSFLEGNESLIQSPDKLYDEINGRREMFLEFLAGGGDLPCYGDKCRYCAVSNMCEVLQTLRRRFNNREKMDCVIEPADIHLIKTMDLSAINGLRLGSIEMLDNSAVKKAARASKAETTVLFRTFPGAGDLKNIPPSAGIDIALNHSTANYFAEKKHETLKREIRVVKENYHTDSESVENDVHLLKYFTSARKAGVKFDKLANIPPCASGEESQWTTDAIIPGIRTAEGAWDLDRFTYYFIKYKNYHKSLRCANCPRFEKCRGLHINYIRTFGFDSIGYCSTK